MFTRNDPLRKVRHIAEWRQQTNLAIDICEWVEISRPRGGFPSTIPQVINVLKSWCWDYLMLCQISCEAETWSAWQWSPKQTTGWAVASFPPCITLCYYVPKKKQREETVKPTPDFFSAKRNRRWQPQRQQRERKHCWIDVPENCIRLDLLHTPGSPFSVGREREFFPVLHRSISLSRSHNPFDHILAHDTTNPCRAAPITKNPWNSFCCQCSALQRKLFFFLLASNRSHDLKRPAIPIAELPLVSLYHISGSVIEDKMGSIRS